MHSQYLLPRICVLSREGGGVILSRVSFKRGTTVHVMFALYDQPVQCQAFLPHSVIHGGQVGQGQQTFEVLYGISLHVQQLNDWSNHIT